VNGIQFETSKKKSDWFGSNSGTVSTFEITSDLVGIRGKSGIYIDAIQFVCAVATPKSLNEIQLGKDIKTTLNSQNFSDVKITVNGDKVVYAHQLILNQRFFFFFLTIKSIF
jgi:hypothetical protein